MMERKETVGQAEGAACSCSGISYFARIALVLLLLAPGIGPTAFALEDAAQARIRPLLEAGRFSEARQLIDAALAADPQDRTALALRAELHRRSGHFAEAITDYTTLTSADPKDVDAWFWLGAVQFWSRHPGPARAALDRALELAPCHGDALVTRARLSATEGAVPAAEKDLEAALACGPGQEEAAELLAGHRLQRGDQEGAKAALARGFQPKDQDKAFGRALSAAGKHKEAEAAFQAALAQSPEDPAAWRGLGAAFREQGRNEEALAAYRRASLLGPKDPGTYYWIGILGTWTGAKAEAYAAFDQLLALRPADIGGLVGKARLLFWDGKNAEAKALLERALAQDPENGEAQVLLAQLLAAEGQVPEARSRLKQRLSVHPEDRDAQTVLAQLPAARNTQFDARSDRSQVIEGLELAGVLQNGIPVVPVKVEYLTDGGGMEHRQVLSDRLTLVAGVGVSREAVYILGRLDAPPAPPGLVYDFDIRRAVVGLDWRLSRAWELRWRLGGTSYNPRQKGSIEERRHLLFGGELEGRVWGGVFKTELTGGSFIQRGFAGDTQFRIFTQDRLNVSWRHPLAKGWSYDTSVGFGRFSDGHHALYMGAGIERERGNSLIWARWRHDPLLGRFFGPDYDLDLIQYDGIGVGGRWTPIKDWVVSGELWGARYGSTPRLERQSGALVEGPIDNNNQRLLRISTSYAPKSLRPFSFGADYTAEAFSFLAGPYNNRNSHGWTVWAQAADGRPGVILYSIKAGRGLTGDDRDGHYFGDLLEGQIVFFLGPHRSNGPLRLGLEGRYTGNRLCEFGRSWHWWLAIPW